MKKKIHTKSIFRRKFSSEKKTLCDCGVCVLPQPFTFQPFLIYNRLQKLELRVQEGAKDCGTLVDLANVLKPLKQPTERANQLSDAFGKLTSHVQVGAKLEIFDLGINRDRRNKSERNVFRRAVFCYRKKFFDRKYLYFDVKSTQNK